MTYQFRPGRLTDREPDTRTYADGRDAAKADSAFLLRIGAAALRDRLRPARRRSPRCDPGNARSRQEPPAMTTYRRHLRASALDLLDRMIDPRTSTASRTDEEAAR